MRPIPWSEPRDRRRPLVYLTLGTVVGTDEVLEPAVGGLASLDADVIVALGSAPGVDLGRLPGNVHVAAFVDQAALMTEVDLVVHQGGRVTILAALANGVKQVLLPKGADQFLNADRMVAAELAAVIMPSDATADTIAIAAKVALAETDRASIDAARAEIEAMPAPIAVIGQLGTNGS